MPRASSRTKSVVPSSKGLAALAWCAVAFGILTSCSSAAPAPEAPPCDRECLDGIAVRGMRDSLKLVFNLTLQGKPVGAHDIRVQCPLGGNARIFGTAFSNAVQGSTEVDLTFELDRCTLLNRDEDPEDNYNLTVTGTVREKGILAVQPTATTALGISSPAMTISGTVSDPPLAFEERDCPLVLQQDANTIAGTICGRAVTESL